MIGYKITQSFKLPGFPGGGNGAGLKPAFDCLTRVWVQGLKKVFFASIGMRICKKTIIQPYRSGYGMLYADPSDIPFDFDGRRTGRAAFRIGQVLGVDFSNVAVFVFYTTRAGNDVAIFEPNRVSWEEPEIFLGRLFAKVVTFNPEFA